jgi:monoamine oxidase
LQAFGDKQMVDQVLIRLHAFYPQARGAFTGYEVRRYSTDAGTGGAYLAYGPGQISKFWRLWERPVQRIAFAGEHTDALYPGTLEGALRSGQRAASQVQDLAAGKSFDPVKAAPVAAAAAAAGTAAAVATKDKGGFFSNLFGGSSAKTEAKPEAAKAEAPKQDKPGFFSRLFGMGDKPEVKAAPAAKAETVAPAPVAAPAAPAAPAPTPAASMAEQAPAKVAPAKPAAAKPAAHKPAAKQTHKPAAKPAPAKKSAAKTEPAKKAVTNTQAKAN